MTPEPLHLRLSEGDVRTLDRYWRAANYLSACQIYLMDDPLLSEPLRPRQVKPRLLRHWARRRASTSSGPTRAWAVTRRAWPACSGSSRFRAACGVITPRRPRGGLLACGVLTFVPTWPARLGR
jgi:hypothetical protein